MKIVHLLSGGLDSTVMLYDLLEQGNKVYCVLFNYGQRNAEAELKCARATCKKLSVDYAEVELARVKNLFLRCALTDGFSRSVIVPNRNGVFLNIACAVAESLKFDLVTFGATRDDYYRFPDCRQQWVDAQNMAALMAELKVRIEAPYIEKTKREIAEIGMDLGVPFSETVSCYNGNDCGKCDACKKRKAALCGQ